MKPPEREENFLTDDKDIPLALIHALHQTIVIVLDFIIAVLQFSPPTSEYGTLPNTEEEMREPEKVTARPKEQRGTGPWSVVIWADDRHTIKEVTRQIRDACGVSLETAEAWAREAEEVVSPPSTSLIVGPESHHYHP